MNGKAIHTCDPSSASGAVVFWFGLDIPLQDGGWLRESARATRLELINHGPNVVKCTQKQDMRVLGGKSS